MNYHVRQFKRHGIDYLELESSKTGEYVLILPANGGTVQQIALHTDGGTARELLENDPPEEILRNPWFRGRILFPFDDRVHAGRYSFNGIEYQLPINDPDGEDALHGFLYAQSLELCRSEASQQMARAVLTGEVAERPGYPFRMIIRLTYTLDAEGFHLDMRIKNSGAVPAPFSVGWHPYFKCAARNAANSELCIPADRYVDMDEKLVPSGRLLPVEGSEYDFRRAKPIDAIVLDHGFENPAGYMEYSTADMIIRIEQSELFAYSQVFIPPTRSSIALEPISAATDAFNKPELGLRVLAPGAEAEGRVSVLVSKSRLTE
ncbi:MAG: aldose 1-epimerase [Spirochaetota bacterium]